MNKSWKSFDLLTTPVFSKKTLRKYSPHTSASRAFTHLKRKIVLSKDANDNNCSSNLLDSKQAVESDDESKIEDASDNEQVSNSNQRKECSMDSPLDTGCSALSIDPKEVTSCRRLNLESDIEDVSEEDASVNLEDEIQETSSDESDCESIRCKKTKSARLDFCNQKSPRCNRRITDDAFIVVNATARAVTLEKPSSWIKPLIVKGLQKSPGKKQHSVWKKLDESFKETHPISGCKSPSNRSWRNLNESFQLSPTVYIENATLTPDNTLPRKHDEIVIEQVPETGQSYDPNSSRMTLPKPQIPRVKYRKGCPLFRLQMVLNERASKQTFWLHERQMGLVTGNRPVKIETICRIFGRLAITYLEPDKDDSEIQVEHTFYIDPAEKQLKSLSVGSLIEVEYDIEPHKLNRRKTVHLGVYRIKAVD